MRALTFCGRNVKEILRDPLNLFFGIGFPVVILLLLSTIQRNIPVSLFEIENLAPGVAVFGLSFMTLFSAALIAKDRESALLQRLYTTPLTAFDYICGYVLSVLPIAIAQSVICYVISVILGLPLSVNILWAVLLGALTSLFFISLGLFCGSVFNVKQVGGICGALLTNLTAWLSGVWFDLELVGGAFKKIAYLLPFVHAAELERAVIRGAFDDIFPHIYWVLGYAAAVMSFAVLAFLVQMKRQ